MCVRFAVSGELIKFSEQLRAWVPLEDWTEGKDMFPGYEAPVIVPDWGTKGRSLVKAKWGLQPFWTKDPKWGQKNAYNARSETIFDKPTFKKAIRERRCIVPASAFYERAKKRWIRLAPPSASTFAIAGLFEPANDLSPLPTFTLVTTEPNEEVSGFHDRMPVVLAAADYEAWLAPDTTDQDLRALMIPCPDGYFVGEDAGPVGKSRESQVSADEKRLFDV